MLTLLQKLCAARFLSSIAPGIVFFFQAEDGIRDHCVTGVQTCALPIYLNKDKRNDPACVWGNLGIFLSSKLYFGLRMPNPLLAKPLLGVGPIDVYEKFI